MADEVGQEAVAGLVVVDAARAAALAIPVATVTTPVTAVATTAPSPAASTRAASVTAVAPTGATPVAASAPVVPVGTASLAALSHDGNPTHPLIRAPAATARTTSPPGHPQVPPTAA